MARARRSQVQRYSWIADRRTKLGVSQKALAEAVGVSLKTIERLEAGRIRDPGIRLINNCALALGVELEAIIEPAWREWLDLDGKHPVPAGSQDVLPPATARDALMMIWSCS